MISRFFPRFLNLSLKNVGYFSAQTHDYNDSTKVFLESINATIKGVIHANYVVEH